MRKIYYKTALAAGFLMCLMMGILPLKNRGGRAFAAAEAQAGGGAEAAQQTNSAQASNAPADAIKGAQAGAAAGNARQAVCGRIVFEGNNFIICRANPARDKIRLFLADERGRYFNYFRNIRRFLAAHGQKALFLMNAGMYHKDYSPVGLYVSEGRQLRPVSVASGKGNFFMKPNGIFYIADSKAAVMETEAFLRAGIKPSLATQSGPMLVVNGRLHPKFYQDSPYKEYRNGAGVDKKGEIFFAISEGKVNFDIFARLFRDGLHCPNALFLDGSIASLYAPSVHRADWFYPMGPIIGVVE